MFEDFQCVVGGEERREGRALRTRNSSDDAARCRCPRSLQSVPEDREHWQSGHLVVRAEKVRGENTQQRRQGTSWSVLYGPGPG